MKTFMMSAVFALATAGLFAQSSTGATTTAKPAITAKSTTAAKPASTQATPAAKPVQTTPAHQAGTKPQNANVANKPVEKPKGTTAQKQGNATASTSTSTKTHKRRHHKKSNDASSASTARKPGGK